MSDELKRFVNDMVTDLKVVERYYNDPSDVVRKYSLTPAEEEAVRSRDLTALADLGVGYGAAEIAMSGRHRTLRLQPDELVEVR